jgi:type I restriction enzyme M protein
MTSIKAKKDPRLKESGKLLSFQLLNETWPKEPKTLFYDWIYMSSIYSNKQLHEEIIKYKFFTDIEFNPKKSYNCQARSAALYVSLFKKGVLDKLMTNKEEYKNYFKKEEYSQMSMFNDSDFFQ